MRLSVPSWMARTLPCRATSSTLRNNARSRSICMTSSPTLNLTARAAERFLLGVLCERRPSEPPDRILPLSARRGLPQRRQPRLGVAAKHPGVVPPVRVFAVRSTGPRLAGAATACGAVAGCRSRCRAGGPQRGGPHGHPGRPASERTLATPSRRLRGNASASRLSGEHAPAGHQPRLVGSLVAPYFIAGHDTMCPPGTRSSSR